LGGGVCVALRASEGVDVPLRALASIWTKRLWAPSGELLFTAGDARRCHKEVKTLGRGKARVLKGT